MNNNEKINHDDHEKKDNKHVCNICNQSFSSGHALGGHKGIHFNSNPTITIDLTRYDFNDNGSNSNLTHVQELHHMCKICYHNFSSRQDLDGHMWLHYLVSCLSSGSGSGSDHVRLDDVVPCSGSGSGSRSDSGSNHVRLHNDNPSNSNLTHVQELHHICKICAENFSSRQDLDNHMRLHYLVPCSGSGSDHVRLHNVVPCSGSGSGSRSGSGSVKHTQEHNNKICSCTTQDHDSSFLTHQNVVTKRYGKSLYNCSDHVRLHNDNPSNSNLTHVQELHHICKICVENFSSRQDLDGHMRLHYLVPCSGSGSGSGLSSGSGHFRLHNEWYVCKICDKSFSSSTSIAGHMGAHYYSTTKDVPNKPLHMSPILEEYYKELNKCKICGQGFLPGQDLQGHMRLHNVVSSSASGSGSGSGSGQSSSQSGQGVGRTTQEFDLNVPVVAEDEDEGVE